jgi:Protein of unknown function (DUF1353)
MPEHELGCYTGRLILQMLPDGRRMKLVEPFGFMEADGLHWSVPPHATVDGASIPQPLWSLIGGPFEGKYRDASVVHDYYCDVRSADWRSVHRMFYRAMLVSGVSVHLAKVMYAAVYFAGPRWSDTAVENVILGPPAIPTRTIEDNNMYSIKHDPITLAFSKVIERDGMSAYDWLTSGRFTTDTNSDITLQLDKVLEMVERDDPSVRSLETAIDKVIDFIPKVDASHREISVGRIANLR